jgi:hypothetical protein
VIQFGKSFDVGAYCSNLAELLFVCLSYEMNVFHVGRKADYIIVLAKTQ